MNAVLSAVTTLASVTTFRSYSLSRRWLISAHTIHLERERGIEVFMDMIEFSPFLGFSSLNRREAQLIAMYDKKEKELETPI